MDTTALDLLSCRAELADLRQEHARVVQEARARERELREALDQQAATGEILRAISRSLTDLGPVFHTVAASVARLVEAPDVVILKVQEGRLRQAASVGPFGKTIGQELDLPLDRSSVCGVALADRVTLHLPDLAAITDPELTSARVIQQRYGQRTMIAAPMLHGDIPLGTIAVLRSEVRPFTEAQVELVETFADQAGIAIRNGQLIQELADKGRQLEIASRHKSAFLSNMSHELRTPLTAIIGFTRIVMRSSANRIEALQVDNLQKILSSAGNLLEQIDAVLDLAKIEAGRIEIRPRRFPLAPMLSDCARTIEPLVKPGVQLVPAFDADLPSLVTDPDKLRQILVNLLGNAAKFTAAGRIELSARTRDSSIEMAVRDTGVGIPADKLDLIFDEFEQADSRSTRTYGGTGLGLAIARRLARAMGGDIAVQSRPGDGSVFTLSLPLQP